MKAPNNTLLWLIDVTVVTHERDGCHERTTVVTHKRDGCHERLGQYIPSEERRDIGYFLWVVGCNSFLAVRNDGPPTTGPFARIDSVVPKLRKYPMCSFILSFEHKDFMRFLVLFSFFTIFARKMMTIIVQNNQPYRLKRREK